MYNRDGYDLICFHRGNIAARKLTQVRACGQNLMQNSLITKLKKATILQIWEYNKM